MKKNLLLLIFTLLVFCISCTSVDVQVAPHTEVIECPNKPYEVLYQIVEKWGAKNLDDFYISNGIGYGTNTQDKSIYEFPYNGKVSTTAGIYFNISENQIDMTLEQRLFYCYDIISTSKSPTLEQGTKIINEQRNQIIDVFINHLNKQNYKAFDEIKIIAEVPELNKDELFVKANQWAVEEFKKSDYVIEFRDKENGIITGKYLSYEEAITKDLEYEYTTLFNIEVKDGKVRLTLSLNNFSYGDEIIVNNIEQQWGDICESLKNYLTSNSDVDW